VLRIAFRRLGDWDQARDAAQDVCLKVLQHPEHIDPSRPIEPWLNRVTVNHCRDRFRRAKVSEPIEEAPDSALDPEQAAMLDEQRRLLSEALLRLPGRERRVLELREIGGYRTGEVARMLGTTSGTVRSQAASGKARLRQILTAGGMIALAVTAWLAYRVSELTPVVPPPAMVARMPSPSLEIPRQAAPARSGARRAAAPARLPAAPAGEQIVMKVVSSDESIVIYWLLETKGEN
jgi:RNA polymerase sigma factor (sigma-70 family)